MVVFPELFSHKLSVCVSLKARVLVQHKFQFVPIPFDEVHEWKKVSFSSRAVQLLPSGDA